MYMYVYANISPGVKAPVEKFSVLFCIYFKPEEKGGGVGVGTDICQSEGGG